MFVRVVRFTDVDPERMASLSERVASSGGPPEGVDSTGIRILHDAQQRTAVVVQEFATAEAMEQSARVLAAMDAGETPGTRASVDTCEVAIELRA